MEKKGIVPVIGTGLFVIIAVLSVITFQSWLISFSSEINVKVETTSSDNLEIVDFIDYDLYVKNNYKMNKTIEEIIIGRINCNYGEINISPGVNKIPIIDNKCRWNLSQSKNDIVLISNSGVYSHTHLFEEIYCFTDYNRDGIINLSDKIAYGSFCAGKYTDIYPPCVDYNEDGIINNFDTASFNAGQYGLLTGSSQKCYKG